MSVRVYGWRDYEIDTSIQTYRIIRDTHMSVYHRARRIVNVCVCACFRNNIDTQAASKVNFNELNMAEVGRVLSGFGFARAQKLNNIISVVRARASSINKNVYLYYVYT